MIAGACWWALGPPQGVANPTNIAASTETSPQPTYLGGEPSPSAALATFPDPLDWSEFAPLGVSIYEVVILDPSPRHIDETGEILSTDFTIHTTNWSCPKEALETFPEKVHVEVYVAGKPIGSPPLWEQSYSVPQR